MMKSRDSIINGREVEIFMMLGQDFIVNGQGIFHDRSKIFVMAG